MEIELFPTDNNNPQNLKYFVMAVTPNRLFQFIGGPTFDIMFKKYASSPSFVELPDSASYSELHFFTQKNGATASYSAWMLGLFCYFISLISFLFFHFSYSFLLFHFSYSISLIHLLFHFSYS